MYLHYEYSIWPGTSISINCQNTLDLWNKLDLLPLKREENLCKHDFFESARYIKLLQTIVDKQRSDGLLFFMLIIAYLETIVN